MSARKWPGASVRYCSTWLERGAKHPNDKGLGLLFTGSNGTGKTHLAVAALRELGERYGARGQFWDYHELMREIRNSYNPATALTEYELLEPVVELDVLIATDGKVASVRVAGAQVHPAFAASAAAAVKQWEFTPTLLNGQPVEVEMTASISFNLTD